MGRESEKDEQDDRDPIPSDPGAGLPTLGEWLRELQASLKPGQRIATIRVVDRE